MYGALSNVYFRFFNIEFARAITLTGQTIIQDVSGNLNNYLNQSIKTDNYPYIFYNDTDSCFCNLSPVVNKFYKNGDVHAIIKQLDKICEERINPQLEIICNDFQKKTGAYKNVLNFKRELIADKMLISGKKHYIMRYYNSEGIVYDKPKLKIKGYEIIKSSTPKKIREMLRTTVDVVMNGDKAETKKVIDDCRREFKSLTVKEISIPKSANNLSKYSKDGIYTKGCPLHVRGALLYNHHIKRLGLNKNHEYIKEGEKVKYVYLKMPNAFRENVISYISELPKEFELDDYIDYDIMFEKVYANALDNIITCLGWQTDEPTGFDI